MPLKIYDVYERVKDDKWAVKRQGNKQPTRVVDSKSEAKREAHEYAEDGGLVRYREHGEFCKCVQCKANRGNRN